MSQLNIQRLNELPGTLAASTLYIVKGTAADVELTFTGTNVSDVRRVLTRADILNLIADNTSSEASKLATARDITATGDISWTVNFDGSANVSAAATLANSGVTAGTHTKVTVDAKGRVTAGAALEAEDIPAEINSDTTGNAATATALATARTINGVSFDGTENITINAVDSTARIASSEKGAASGVAPLNASSQIDEAYLPSYVDDVLEFASYELLPATGEQGKIYVVLDTNRTYRWSGSTYIWIGAEVDVADSADTLSTARDITATGDISWTVNFNGSQNVSAAATLSNTGIDAGSYPKVTVDAKGRVVNGSLLSSADIPNNAADTTGNAATATTANHANTATIAYGVELTEEDW